MLIFYKILTIGALWLGLWLFWGVTMFLPTYFYPKFKKMSSFPAIFCLVLAAITYAWSVYRAFGCGGEECLFALFIWPIVAGVAVGSFLLMLALSYLAKRLDWNLKKVFYISLIISFALMAVFHVVVQPKYSVDKKVIALAEEHNLDSCVEAEYGFNMLVSGFRDYLLDRCYYDISFLTGDSQYCEKIAFVSERNACLAETSLVKTISEKKCGAGYDYNCVMKLCGENEPKKFRDAWVCANDLAGRDSSWCSVFRNYKLHNLENCQK